MTQQFPKRERLKSLTQIQACFSHGIILRSGCIKAHWQIALVEDQETSGASRLKAGFSVPKKKIRRAVHRNQLRRKIKEVFRLNKASLYPLLPENKQLHIFFIYTERNARSFTSIEKDLKTVLNQLEKQLADIKQQE